MNASLSSYPCGAYICQCCGVWVAAGEWHWCRGHQLYQETPVAVYYTGAGGDPEIYSTLGKILEKLDRLIGLLERDTKRPG